MRRWRMLLGEASADELGASLSREEQQMDAALGALYDADDEEGIDEPRRPRGSDRPHRGSPAGSATSGPTSRPAWSR